MMVGKEREKQRGRDNDEGALDGRRLQVCYLLFAGFVCGHVTLQLRAAAQGLTAERAGQALLVLLVPILDVFLQRRQALVAALTVRTGEQLGKVVRRVTLQLCTQSKTEAILSSPSLPPSCSSSRRQGAGGGSLPCSLSSGPSSSGVPRRLCSSGASG